MYGDHRDLHVLTHSFPTRRSSDLLAVQPAHLQARAELGRAYIALNEPEAARRELALVESQEAVPQDVRETLQRYVAALDTGLSGGGTRISGKDRKSTRLNSSH